MSLNARYVAGIVRRAVRLLCSALLWSGVVAITLPLPDQPATVLASIQGSRRAPV
ncbi:hypothetical protein [Acetobacter sp.]|uniref:hypothetical protein n=1 Tax=Acetobacter sp. TaxID=440 RepID=UPI0025BCF5A0|nr:hypothetical protein [Acetobacter sp.]MCH4089649.1 hypothetical protein [Acetobacter sp.]MCI1300629.1 hypothetical protein [Acetobacter sp.]MCI1317023.1 hypothetical protein [Acetobacter sp.]